MTGRHYKIKYKLSQSLCTFFTEGILNKNIEDIFHQLGYWEAHTNKSKNYEYDLLLKQIHFNIGNEVESILLKNNIDSVRIKSFSFPVSSFPKQLGRRLNDVDLWIKDPKDFKSAISLLKENSFQVYQQNRWEAADNRVNVYKDLSYCQAYIDIHQSLAWDLNPSFEWQTVTDPLGYCRLEDSHLIMHLLINWIYQDGLNGIEKLIDIYYLLSNSLTIDHKKIINDSKKLQLEHTIDFGLTLLNYFHVPQTESFIPSRKSKILAERVFETDFLFNPYKHKMLFIYLKHFVRKNLTQAFYYDYLKVLSFLRFKSETSDLDLSSSD